MDANTRRAAPARLGLWASMALTLAVAAAAGTAPRAAGIVGGATASSSAAIARADGLLFTNRYSDAEAAYLAAIRDAPTDPAPHAAYALFLAYRQQLDGARQQAQEAVAIAPRSGYASAILCRAQDWSSHLQDAVAAGRRAVTLAPDQVVAHLFLSEALADTGDPAGARRQLDAARLLLTPQSPSFLRAELQREQGNLARDAGDTAAAVAAFRSAWDIQPGWVERATEVAGAQLDGGDVDGSRRTLTRAVELAPDDASLLDRLLSVALLQPDYPTADRVTAALLRLEPSDPGVLDAAAHVAMAAHGDSSRARSLLRESLGLAPGDEEAAAYLLFLDRYVVGDAALATAELAHAEAAGADELTPGHLTRAPRADPDRVLAADAAAALAQVNRIRAAAGLGPVRIDARLRASAAAHSFYWLFNGASPTVAKLGIHRETPGLPGFSGAGPGDRAIAFGYREGPVGEDITHRGSPAAAIGDWLNSVYHRFPILRPDLVAIGFADARVGPLPIEDMEFAFVHQGGSRHAPVVYPADHMTAVPTAFADNELPDPIPQGAPRIAGFPVTVTFDVYAPATVTSFTLTGPGGADVPGYVLAPQGQTENSASLVPRVPLRPNTQYTARIAGTFDGAPYVRTWTFTTGT